MPKKSSIDINTLITILKEKKDTIIDKKTIQIRPPTHPCWLEVQKLYGYTVSVKYIYAIVKLNRYDILSKLGLKLNDNTIKEDTEIPLNNNEYYSDESSDNNENESTLKFNLTISKEEWKIIYNPLNVKQYHRSDKNTIRNYQTLTEYVWSPIINEHFFEQTRLSCSMIYKHAKIYLCGVVFLDIIGH